MLSIDTENLSPKSAEAYREYQIFGLLQRRNEKALNMVGSSTALSHK